jgi:dehydrogenase/reductase SDR family protein 4
MLRSSLVLRPVLRRMSVSSTRGGDAKFEGKVAIVTASTDGIGYAIAERLLRDGAKVMVSSRKERNVERAVERLREGGGGDVGGVVCHVGKADDRRTLLQETVRRFGGLDILVSNAAVNPAFGDTTTVEESVWDKILDVNVKCTALLVKEALPYLKERRNASIVIVSSIGGFMPFSALGPYSTSKTALLGLTKALATELAPAIRVNCIAPGIIKTKFSSAIWQNDVIAAETIKNIPMGRLGEAEECAGAVSFLCSEDASYITGETIVISGGMPSRL